RFFYAFLSRISKRFTSFSVTLQYKLKFMEKIKLIRKKSIPDTFQNIETWESNRRTFLRGALIAGALSQISLFTSCTPQLKEGNDMLSAQQATILNDILAEFFPADGNGPSYEDINAFGYIMWVL